MLQSKPCAGTSLPMVIRPALPGSYAARWLINSIGKFKNGVMQTRERKNDDAGRFSLSGLTRRVHLRRKAQKL